MEDLVVSVPVAADDMSQFWRGRPVYVTGATGLVGSWLVRDLVAAGAEVVCLVRDWVPQSELVRARTIDQVRVVHGDVRDLALSERVIAEYEVATVFHLAAQTIVGTACVNPICTLETNIAGTYNVLEACRRNRTVREVVIASSDKVYGEQDQVPCDEGSRLGGRHPYDASKVCTDVLAEMFATTYDMPVVITRCGNLYGGGDLNWNRLVPGTIRSIVHGQRPIIRSDGSLVRDYFHVEDGAAAYRMLAEALHRDRDLAGQAFNFSDERPVSALELVRRIASLMDSALEPIILNEVKDEIRIQALSAAKARRLLHWAPRHGLEEGLRRTIGWYASYFRETGS
jgi:CDP-glucose 4,6-dehydratase